MNQFSMTRTSSSRPTTTKTDARDADALMHFLRMSVDDVRARATRELEHVGGSTWAGLLRLMERRRYGYVYEIGATAAESWAIQLALVRRG
jgi:hypothetical protein